MYDVYTNKLYRGKDTWLLQHFIVIFYNFLEIEKWLCSKAFFKLFILSWSD